MVGQGLDGQTEGTEGAAQRAVSVPTLEVPSGTGWDPGQPELVGVTSPQQGLKLVGF